MSWFMRLPKYNSIISTSLSYVASAAATSCKIVGESHKENRYRFLNFSHTTIITTLMKTIFHCFHRQRGLEGQGIVQVLMARRRFLQWTETPKCVPSESESRCEDWRFNFPFPPFWPPPPPTPHPPYPNTAFLFMRTRPLRTDRTA